MTDTLPPPSGERYTLKAEEELRLEIPTTATLTLQKGSAEILGSEVALQFPLQLEGNVPIFTWHGCTVDIEGEFEAYDSDETNSNVAVVNTHAQLEALRDAAAASPNLVGPRVMICGPPESGKTTVCKTLAAYAVKLGRHPILCDLDPADNCLTVPGTLSACPLSSIDTELWAATGVPAHTAVTTRWHGNTAIQADLFRLQVTQLGEQIRARLQNDASARSSGILVNTSTMDLDLLGHVVDVLDISVILILGHDKLYSKLKDWEAKVVKLPRSGGVVSRTPANIRSNQSRALKRYFHGPLVSKKNTSEETPSKTRAHSLTPFLVQIPLKELTVYKAVITSLSKSMLPVAAAQETQAVQVEEHTGALRAGQVMAVCHPQADDVLVSGIAGIVHVERFVEETEMVHLLSPCAGALASHRLLIDNITWME